MFVLKESDYNLIVMFLMYRLKLDILKNVMF